MRKIATSNQKSGEISMQISLPSKPINMAGFCKIVRNVMTSLPLEENDERIELKWWIEGLKTGDGKKPGELVFKEESR